MALSLTKLVDGVATFQSTIIPKGAYVAETIYVAGESVSYESKSYVAIQPTQGNLPTDTDYWQLLCEGGSGGATAFTDLTDVPSAYTDQAGKIVAVNAGADALEFITNTGGSDEKVKYDAGDTTAGYVADKVVAGTGISVAEGTGADENKLVVTSSITQYTDEMAQDAVGNILTDSSEIDFTYTDGTPEITASIKSGSIDETKLDSSTNASLDLADGSIQSTIVNAKGDLIVASANDTPAILTVGTNDYVLTADSSTATGLKWAASSGGMTNPMSAAGDIIIGGVSGAATRLAKGDDGEVLKLVSGVPSWEADAGGMTDPMTTRGDIIYRDASAPARLAKGASGTVLTMGANDPAWAVPFSQTTQTLTDGATVSWDASAGSCGILTLGGNRALANMTNAIAGRTYTLIVKQDGTGSRTLSYGNQYFTPGDTTPVLSSTANAVDILQFLAESSTVFHLINFISDSK